MNEYKQDRWVEELIATCSKNAFYIGEGHVMTLLAAIKDLEGWLNDQRRYNGMHKQGWTSSINDFNLSLKSCGRRLRALIRADAFAIKALLQRVPPSQADRRGAKLLMSQILLKLEKDEALKAAWLDLVDGCKNKSLSQWQVELRRDAMWDIARLKHIDTGTFGIGKQLSDVLRNREFDVAIATSLIRHEKYPDISSYDMNKHSDLTINQRLRICGRLLTVKLLPSHNIVWLTINNASLHKPVSNYGAITLYEGEWFRAVLHGDPLNPNYSSLPEEIINNKTTPEGFKYDFVDVPHTIFARVDTGIGMLNESVDRARDTLTALINYVLPEGDSWKIRKGYLSFKDSLPAGSNFSPNEEYLNSYSSQSDSTSIYLEESSKEIGNISTSVNSLLQDALRLRMQLNQVSNSDPIVKIITAVRVLELTNSWTSNDNKKWYDYAKKYHKLSWARLYLINNIDDVIGKAVTSSNELQGENKQKLSDIRSKVFQSSITPSGFSFHRDEAILHLPDLVKLYDNEYCHRSLKDLESQLNGGHKAYLSILRFCNKDFKILIGRLQRYRNSAEHGGPMTDLAHHGLAAFATMLAHIALLRVVEGLLEGKRPIERIIEAHKIHTHLLKRLKVGASISELFF